MPRCPRSSQPAVRKCVWCAREWEDSERRGRKGETCRGADGGKDRQDKRTTANQMRMLRARVYLSPLSPDPSPTTAFTPRPLSLFPLSLHKAREVPEDRLGQVAQPIATHNKMVKARRPLKIVSGRLLSLLSLTLMDTSLVRPLQIVSGKLLS